MQIWRALVGHLRHLFFMMSLDYLLAIRHKKGEYIWMEIGGDFFFGSFGALDCIYVLHLVLNFWLMMYLF